MIAGRITAAIVIALLVICQSLASSGLHYNTTTSVPTGFYWLDHNDREPQVGEFAAFCLPTSPIQREALHRGYLARGTCPGGAGLLLKVVAAIPGDQIDITTERITINGRTWSHSCAREQDDLGRPLPHITGKFNLPASKYFMLSYHSDSFDSRYFGPISLDLVRGTARPLARED